MLNSMRSLHTKFLLAAALLTTSSTLQAAKFWPTSPLIQIGDDTDIFFDASASLSLNDNLFSSENKVSGTTVNVTPGFTLEYGKDSPLFVIASLKRAQINYYGGNNLSRLNNYQDTISGTVFIDQGGPLKFTLKSDYSESARNDNLTQLGIDGNSIGETLVRQANYNHSIKTDYRLTEKTSANLIIANKYNRYLNPTKIRTYYTPPAPAYVDTYNTNKLSEINTKSIELVLTYLPPGDLITYGLSYTHDQNDFSPAFYYESIQDGPATTSRPSANSDVIKSVKDFYGFTATGRLTRSGKLSLNTRFGFSSSTATKFDKSNSKLTGLSYNFDLKHQLTDLIEHSISVGRSTAPTPNGADSDSKTYGYTISYSATDTLVLNLHLNKTDVVVDPSVITTMDYNLEAVYNYNSHLNFSAVLDSLKTSIGATSYQTNSLVIQASFRY